MNVIIGNAWPYANGPLHLGRIAVLMPGDVLARYHRLMGDEVVFISGSDSHGNLVANKAIEEGKTPLETSEKYHEEFVKCFNKLGFSFDVFTKTHTKYHSEMVKKFIIELYDKGYIYEKVTKKKSLQDDYVDDEGETEEEKETKHLYFSLSKLEKDVKRVFIKQQGWRQNAQAITKRYLDGGLRDRAVTRDSDWGVDVPLDGYEDKKIFVWIEALMGYLTASIKCLEERGEDYREYWQGDDSRVYLVHGKDNIPFHTVIFPAILVGLGIKNPAIREISSEYLTLEGKMFSTGRNWAIWVDHIIDRYSTDQVRYYLMRKGPEDRDSDFTWRDFTYIVNNELSDLYGNFVNRTLTFIQNNFNGQIPKGKLSKEITNELFNLYFNVGDKLEEGRFKEGLQDIMNMVKKANKIFDNEKPWETIKTDINKCNETIYTCIQLVLNFSNLLEPFMPVSSEKIREALDIKNAAWSLQEKRTGYIKEIGILFNRVDKKNVSEEINKLKKGI